MQQAHRQWIRSKAKDHRRPFPQSRITQFRPFLELPESKREASQKRNCCDEKRNTMRPSIQIVTHLLTASRKAEQLQCRNAGQNIEGQSEPECGPEPLVLFHARSIPEGSHGLEIRGWKVPSVQGTQEKSNGAARHNLNVASTVGFSQPRISNPWPPIRGLQSVALCRPISSADLFLLPTYFFCRPISLPYSSTPAAFLHP